MLRFPLRKLQKKAKEYGISKIGITDHANFNDKSFLNDLRNSVTSVKEFQKTHPEINSITNTEFYASSAEKLVPKLIEGGERPDVVIFDPPRKGSDEATLSAIIKAKPDAIVVVNVTKANAPIVPIPKTDPTVETVREKNSVGEAAAASTCPAIFINKEFSFFTWLFWF